MDHPVNAHTDVMVNHFHFHYLFIFLFQIHFRIRDHVHFLHLLVKRIFVNRSLQSFYYDLFHFILSAYSYSCSCSYQNQLHFLHNLSFVICPVTLEKAHLIRKEQYLNHLNSFNSNLNSLQYQYHFHFHFILHSP